MTTISEVLERAAEIVEKGWCRKVVARDAQAKPVGWDSQEACSWCAYGAIFRAALELDRNSPSLSGHEAASSVEQCVGGALGPWNDMKKTKRTVCKKLREIAAKERAKGDAMRKNLFQRGHFTLVSGDRSRFKIDCDALTGEDIDTLAYLLYLALPSFGQVEGVPTGGLRIAKALRRYSDTGNPQIVIVDDVLTSGRSIEQQRAGRSTYGAVLFARGPCPKWVYPLFSLGRVLGDLEDSKEKEQEGGKL